MAPSSAPTAATVSPVLVTLSLFKLSYCTTSLGAKMLWTHLPNRDDMFAVFDQVKMKDHDGIVRDRRLLKLVRGADNIETIDFDVLKYQARTDEEAAKSQQIPDELLRVIVLVKNSLLALRYQLPDGKSRRIQMNFRPETGCDTALAILKSIGLPVRDKNQPGQPRQPLRPHSAQATFPRSQSRSQAAPVSSQPRSQEHLGGYISAYNAIPSSAQPPRAPPLAPSPMDDNNADGFSKPISYIRDPRLAVPSISNNSSKTDDKACPYCKVVFADLGAHLDRIANNKKVRRQGDPHNVEEIRQLRANVQRKSNRPSSSNENSQDSSAANRPNSASATLGSTTQTVMMPSTSRQLLPRPNFENQSSPFGGYAYQPASAPEMQSEHVAIDTGSLSQMLPPVRKLPFPDKPPGRDNQPTSSPLGESSTKMQVEPKLKKRKKNRASAGKAISVNASHVPVTSSSAPKTRTKNPTAAGDGLKPMASSSAPPQTRITRSTSARAVSPIQDLQDFRSSPSTLKASLKTTGKQPVPVAGVDSSPLRNRQAPAQDEQQSSPAPRQKQAGELAIDFPDITPAEVLDSLDGWIRKFHDLPAPQPPQTDKERLAEYAGKSDEERAQIFDDMIIECLEDENFAKLVEDVEGHWKRICLGF